VPALGLRPRLPHRLTGTEPEVAEAREQPGEEVELVARRPEPEGEHHRGVERTHVAVQDGADDPLAEDRGVPARQLARHLGSAPPSGCAACSRRKRALIWSRSSTMTFWKL
jgi:hypothetical protein